MKNDRYKKLENTMLRYRDVIQVPVVETGEKLIAIPVEVIPNGYIPPMMDMEKLVGKRIIVRCAVYDRLLRAQALLKQVDPALSLYLTFGYRPLEFQTMRFLGNLAKVASQQYFENPVDLYEEANRYIAVPSVAGHPTGGAVDIAIVDEKSKKFLDFGSELYDFTTKNCYVFAPQKKKARENRMLLRTMMMNAEFAPFDGEWWHFSYGDREWACYYKKSIALYSQLSLSKVKSMMRNLKGGE